MELTEKMICALLRAYICESSWCAMGTMAALKQRGLVEVGEERRPQHGFPEYKIVFTPEGLQMAQSMINQLSEAYQ